MPFMDDNQKVVELSAILEIGILKSEHARYKTKVGVERHVETLAFDFMQRVKNLGDMNVPIYMGSYVTQEGDLTVINDFNYSGHNQCPKSKTEIVYRLFGSHIYTILPIDADPVPLMCDYWYEFKGHRVLMIVCGSTCSEKCNIHYTGSKAPVFVRSESIG
jgi:hypothetical protein